MYRNSACFSFVVLFIFSCCQIQAQGCCAGGAPLAGNTDLSILPGRTFTFRLSYDRNKINDLVAGSEELTDNSRSRVSSSVLLRAGYAFNDKIAVTTLLSYNAQTERAVGFTEANELSARGLGDAVVLLQYNLFNNGRKGLSVAAGVKMPTGAVDRRDEQNDLLLRADLQPGTRAFDYLLNTRWVTTDIANSKFNFEAGAVTRIATATERFESQQKYKFGNEAQVFASLSRNFYLKKFLLIPQAGLRCRYSARDQINGNKSSDTGGYRTFLSSGALVTSTGGLSIAVQYNLPLYRYLNGLQLATTYSYAMGVEYTVTRQTQIDFVPVF